QESGHGAIALEVVVAQLIERILLEQSAVGVELFESGDGRLQHTRAILGCATDDVKSAFAQVHADGHYHAVVGTSGQRARARQPPENADHLQADILAQVNLLA